MNARAPLLAACLAALLALSACTDPAAPPEAPRPPQRPAAPAPKPAAPPEPERSALSRELERYYAGVQNSLLNQGLLRRDKGGRDTPFDKRVLVENFVRIALFEEYTNAGGRLVARQTESRLHRWERPVRIELEFGDTIPEDKRATDRRAVEALTKRLAEVTDHPIRTVRSGGNFNVFIVNEDERRALAPRLQEMLPGLSRAALDTVIDLPRSSYCLVFALDPSDTGAYTRAVAIIRGEHPDLLRLSCIHEEIAQGLGLSNDSPSARPSIFNDDEEFALLTTQDEMMLRLLYDPRMKIGMSVSQARGAANVIAAEYFNQTQ